MEKINYKALNRLIGLFTVLVILGILYSLNLLENVKHVFAALTPFYLALLILWIMKPLANYLQESRGMSSKKASLLSILVNLLVVLSFLFVIVPVLIAQIWDITQNSTQIVDSIQANVTKITDYFQVRQIDVIHEVQLKAAEYLNIQSFQDILMNFDFGFVTDTFNAIIGAIGSVTGFVLNIVFAYIIAIYLSSDFDGFVEKSLNLLFKNAEQKNRDVFFQSTKALSGYFKGLLLDCSFVALIVTVGSAIIGVPSPLLFGILAGLFNVIPYLGPILGGVPLIIVALSQGIPTALAATVVVFGTQFIESQILQPRIMANSTNLHPSTVIIGLIIFGTLFGFVGMIIATPTLAVIAVIIKNSKLDIRI